VWPSVVALAASAGGVEALLAVVQGLPPDLPAAVVVVLHSGHVSHLAQVLARRTRMTVEDVVDGRLLEPGHLYVAQPDHHVTVDAGGRLRLDESPAVRFHRPSADVLFESVAALCGVEAVGVVLSGTGDDGTRGARAIKEHGGTVLAQDDASLFAGMPAATVRAGLADRVLPVETMAAVIGALARRKRDRARG